ncbi:MAG: hypothetical protein SNJ57_13065 [Cyanobacteriota bacterium]
MALHYGRCSADSSATAYHNPIAAQQRHDRGDDDGQTKGDRSGDFER